MPEPVSFMFHSDFKSGNVLQHLELHHADGAERSASNLLELLVWLLTVVVDRPCNFHCIEKKCHGSSSGGCDV